MLEANEGLEKIFEDAVKEAEKRKHEYVTIEHVLLSLVKDKVIGTTLTEFKINVGALIKDIEDYLDTKFLPNKKYIIYHSKKDTGPTYHTLLCRACRLCMREASVSS